MLAAQVAQCLGCDAEVVTVSESCGLPIDVGRRRRVVSTRLRRALEARDRCCRFPGCAVPARMAHAHHIRHWAQGGRTDLANVVSLCGFHHRRLHGGIYAIRVQKDGTLRFETADGTSIGPDLARERPAGRTPWEPALEERLPGELSREPEAARARDGGRLSMDYAISVLSGVCERRQQRLEAGCSSP